MVVSEVTRAWTRRDKAPVVDISAPPMVEDASESSRESPRAARASPPKREAYVMVNALKSLISTMADAITRQVSEQVKRAMEVAGSTKPVHGGKPFRRPEGMSSLCPMECGREVAWSYRSDRLLLRRQAAVEPVARSARRKTVISATASTPLHDTFQTNCLA